MPVIHYLHVYTFSGYSGGCMQDSGKLFKAGAGYVSRLEKKFKSPYAIFILFNGEDIELKARRTRFYGTIFLFGKKYRVILKLRDSGNNGAVVDEGKVYLYIQSDIGKTAIDSFISRVKVYCLKEEAGWMLKKRCRILGVKLPTLRIGEYHGDAEYYINRNTRTIYIVPDIVEYSLDRIGALLDEALDELQAHNPGVI